MSYVICKHPAVRIDLLCKKEFWPKLVSDIQRCECTYEKEEQLTYASRYKCRVRQCFMDIGNDLSVYG